MIAQEQVVVDVGVNWTGIVPQMYDTPPVVVPTAVLEQVVVDFWRACSVGINTP